MICQRNATTTFFTSVRSPVICKRIKSANLSSATREFVGLNSTAFENINNYKHKEENNGNSTIKNYNIPLLIKKKKLKGF